MGIVPVAFVFAAGTGLPLERWDWDDPDLRARAEALRIRTPPTLALLDGDRVRFRLTGRLISRETAAHLLANVRPAPPA